MASLIQPLAISGARDSLGAVVAGGRVYLTVPGAVNTAVTAYTDADQSSAVSLDSGGYLLDSGGRANLYVSSPCSVRVDNSAGVTVGTFTYGGLTADNLVEVTTPGWTGINSNGSSVSGGRTYLDTVLGSLYTSLGGLDGKYRGTYGTADTNIKTEIEQIGLTPQRFGAKGDGVTDDTNAFLLLAAAQSGSGLPVFLPRGTYKISSVIQFGSNLVMRGCGWGAGGSVIQGTSASQNAISTTGSFANLSNFEISHATSSSGIGLQVTNFTTMISVYVHGYATSIGGSASLCTAVGSIFLSNVTASIGANANFFVDGMGSQIAGASGTFPATTMMYQSASVSTSTANTQDLANGGSAVLSNFTQGQTIVHQRIRATSAGAGTVGAIIATGGVKFVILDLYNNSGGAFTFNLSSGAGQYKSSGAPAPANGSRTCVTFVWEQLDNAWVEMSRATST